MAFKNQHCAVWGRCADLFDDHPDYGFEKPGYDCHQAPDVKSLIFFFAKCEVEVKEVRVHDKDDSANSAQRAQKSRVAVDVAHEQKAQDKAKDWRSVKKRRKVVQVQVSDSHHKHVLARNSDQ